MTSVEKTFASMCRSWRAKVEACPKGESFPYQVDQLAMASLLFCNEHQETLGESAREEIKANVDLLYDRHKPKGALAAIDAMPWDLCKTDNYVEGDLDDMIEQLEMKVDHSSSSMRHWANRMAWFVMEHLTPEQFLLPLFNNVANKLGYIIDAMGLAYRIAGSDEAVEAALLEYTPPERFAKQFERRIELFRSVGFGLAEVNLLEHESNCRKIITEYALAIK